MRFITSICIRIIIAVCVCYSGGRALAQDDWIQPVANRSLPSVVTVLSFDGDGKQFGMGSGFIVGKDGLVVTCYHVIQNASAVEVRNREIGSYRVKGVVAVDRDMDFAVLKITAIDIG
jgi:S1-C subfamily serine protease